jgi:hypothetical protein
MIVTAFAVSTSAIASLIAAIYGVRNHSKINNVKELVNGQSEKLLSLTGTAAHAVGKIEGIQEERNSQTP